MTWPTRPLGRFSLSALTFLLGTACRDEATQEGKPFVGQRGSGQAEMQISHADGTVQTVSLVGTLPFFSGSAFGCAEYFYGPTFVDSREAPTWRINLRVTGNWITAVGTYPVESTSSPDHVAHGSYKLPECVLPASISLSVKESPLTGLIDTEWERVHGEVNVDVMSYDPRINFRTSYDVTWENATEAPGISIRLVGTAGIRFEDETRVFTPEDDEPDPIDYDYSSQFCQLSLAHAASQGCVSDYLLPSDDGMGGGPNEEVDEVHP